MIHPICEIEMSDHSISKLKSDFTTKNEYLLSLTLEPRLFQILLIEFKYSTGRICEFYSVCDTKQSFLNIQVFNSLTLCTFSLFYYVFM